jgi:hypothetical protein
MIRALIALLLTSVISTMFGSYTVRLYFRNETTGQENAGALFALPGDRMTLRYSYHGDTNWGTLQMAIDLSQSSIVSATDASQWLSQVRDVFMSANFFSEMIYGPGALYDSAREPSDNTQPLVSTNALYALGQISYNDPNSKDFDATLFKFTVASSTEGQELHWINEGRWTQDGVSTRVILPGQQTQLITDNFVRVRRNHIIGKIDFTRAAPTFKMPSTISMRFTPAIGSQFNQTVHLDSGGNFDVALRAGVYDVSVQYTHWLRRSILVDASQGDVTGATFTLVNGDAFVDGLVNLKDINWIFVYFGTSGQNYSDLNQDGTTDLLDLNIVFTNFGLSGDP